MTFLAAAPGEPFYMNAEIWVMVSFFIFLGILGYFGVHTAMGKALDDRAERIKKELDDAKRLRDDAQALLAEYQKKAREAETEAKTIIDQARRDAAAMAEEARRNLEDTLARRTRLAEEKIGRAEAQALADVKSSAIDAAVKAAEQIVKKRAATDTGNALVDKSIKALGSRLN